MQTLHERLAQQALVREKQQLQEDLVRVELREKAAAENLLAAEQGVAELWARAQRGALAVSESPHDFPYKTWSIFPPVK